MRVNEFIAFINARERHRIAKETGKPIKNPDPIISEYRFCNVRRNDDRVTKFVFASILEPFRDDPHLWFYLTIARLFNNPTSLRAFTYNQYRKWDAEIWRMKLKKLRETGTIFNAAYIVSTNGQSMDKVDYIIDRVLTPMWKNRAGITRDLNVGQLANVHLRLLVCTGLGSFMAAQIVADLKYAHPGKWEDFHTFAASGPGSRRGLNRVCGFKVGDPWNEAHWRAMLRALRDKTNARLKMEPLTAHDIQNCLCEFDKYERVRLGEGYPKQLYKPRSES
jgi:hypothetical protein